MGGRDDRQDRGCGRDRDVRLAEALRQNLRRRKAQARSRREPAPARQEPGSEPDCGDETAQDGPGD